MCVCLSYYQPCWQTMPEYPAAQRHLKPSCVSRSSQVPPFWHGPLLHVLYPAENINYQEENWREFPVKDLLFLQPPERCWNHKSRATQQAEKNSFVEDVRLQYLHCTDEDQQSETVQLSWVDIALQCLHLIEHLCWGAFGGWITLRSAPWCFSTP